ncbi:MAG: type II secretion system F family protein [Bdellovibrionota bacterium]
MRIKYEGYNNAAKKVAGEVEADDATEARGMLRAKGIRASKLILLKGGASAAAPRKNSPSAKPQMDWGNLASVFDAIASPVPSLIEFAAFIRQMSVMQAAGIPTVQALNVLAETVETKGFGRALADIRSKVEGGQSFTEALRHYPAIFDRIFVNLVAAGEVSGSLDKILDRLAGYYEKTSKLRRKVVSAMTYPAFMLVIMVVIVSVMLIFVVPTFAEMFQSNGQELPGPTKMVLHISDLIRHYWWAYLGGIGITVAGISYTFKNEKARAVIDPALIKLPLIGPLLAKIAIARFSRTFGTLIQSGVPILEALDITARVAGNIAVEKTLLNIKAEVSQGNSISGPLMKSGIFPKMATSMIAIGEQTGAIDGMLQKIADFYEDEVDAAVGGITSIIEPLMIVLVGAVVAGILIPMYLPIFKMGETVGGG